MYLVSLEALCLILVTSVIRLNRNCDNSPGTALRKIVANELVAHPRTPPLIPTTPLLRSTLKTLLRFSAPRNYLSRKSEGNINPLSNFFNNSWLWTKLKKNIVGGIALYRNKAFQWSISISFVSGSVDIDKEDFKKDKDT